jgi:hypothetical protein
MSRSTFIKKNILQILFATIILSIVPATHYCQQTVLVKYEEMIGRGILKSRGSECFVITPEHVVRDVFENINIIGTNNVQSYSKIEKVFENDLAVLRIQGGGSQNCEYWEMPNNIDAIIDNALDGFLIVKLEDGSEKLVGVSFAVKNSKYLVVKPEEELKKGYSGSSLFCLHEGKKVLVGMLLNVNEDGNGDVIKVNVINSAIDILFKSKLTITSNVTNARVFLNGKEVASLINNKGEYLMNPGTVKISLEKDKFKNFYRELDIKADTFTLNANLEEIIGKVIINTEPKDAEAIFDDGNKYLTPVNISLPYGVYNVKLIKENYNTESFTININDSKTYPTTINLVPSLDYVADQRVKSIRRKALGGFLVASLFAGGAYYGYKYFDNKLISINQELSMNPPIKTNEDKKSLYTALKYTSIGLGGVVSLGAISNLFKSLTYSKSKYLRDRERSRVK